MKNRKKNFGKRSLFAATLAAMMLTLTCSTAYADSNADTSVPVSDAAYLTDIGGYACYQRDENYWTVIDGEEYLVVDTRAILAPSSKQAATYALRTSIDAPSGWGNSIHVNLPDGNSYTDSVDLSNGDYYSPIYEVTPKMNDYRFKFDTNHIVSHTYDLIFYYHFQSPVDEWHPEPVTLTFSCIPGYKIIMPGTMSGIIDGVGVKIKSSSPGRRDFKYTITPL